MDLSFDSKGDIMGFSKRSFIIIFALLASAAAIYWWMQPAKEKKISGAYKAIGLWSEQRAYPDKFMPDAGFAQAHTSARNNIHKSAANKTVDPWETMGPHNLGGRTLALAFNPQNPNTIYAGSASGGLWRSYTAGRGTDAWEYVSTGFPVLGVGAIEFAPNDSNTIYIGTGEVYNYRNAGTGAAYRSQRGTYGIGILKSTDGGDTWEKSLDWSFNQLRGVWAIKVNPLNPNTVWATTTEGTYRSLDAGGSWTQMHTVVMGNDLVINAADTNIVIATYGNFSTSGNGLYRTTNSGATWSKITQGVPLVFNGKAMLRNAPSDPNIIYASFGNGFGFSDGASWLCRSDDAGATWTIKSTLDYSQWQGWFAHDVAVHPTNPEQVTVIGIHIYQSTNGGTTLLQKSAGGSFTGRVQPGAPEGPPTYSHPDHHDVHYHPTDPNIIYFANDGGVFRSTNGGTSFEACNGGYQTSQFYNGFASSASDSLLSIGGFQDNSTAIYDGQLAWRVRLIGGDGGWAAIDARNGATMYGSWQGLNVLKSTNNGQSFFNIAVPNFTGGGSVFIAPFVVAEDDPDVIYAGRDVIYKSTNGGLSWQGTNSNSPVSPDGTPVFSMAVSATDNDVVYAGLAPLFNFPRAVYRTTDGGGSWQNISSGLPNRFPTDVTVDPNDPATAYITFSGFNTNHLFKTTNYGNTWTSVSNGLPDLPTNAVIVDPLYSERVYVGNDIGVYASVDGGENWELFTEGLPDVVLVMDLSISPLNRELRVATHGNGAYKRPLIETISGIDDIAPLANTFALAQNYPNPFNPSTNIGFRISDFGFTSLKVYDLLGREVATLKSENLSPGNYEVVWDGRDNSGQAVASGTYIYRLTTGKQQISKLMQLVR